MKTHKKTSSVILAGASLLVLSSCLPQDEATLSDNSLRNIESQIQSYSKAFQQYANRSLNAVVSSDAWNNNTLSEGAIDLTDAAFGVNMGNAEAYLESAHCKNGLDSFHLTWFDSADTDGNISLKGLGESQIGRTSARVQNALSHTDFGVFDGTDIQMSDGAVFTLSGNCAALNMPVGTAVSAISMPTPQNIIVAQETRTVLRSAACPTGEQGGVTQSVNAEFYAEPFDGTNTVKVGTDSYINEQDVVDNHATWNEISRNCFASVVAQNLSSTDQTVDIIDLSSLITTNDMASALSGLEDVTCRVVHEDDADISDTSIEIVNTCGTDAEVDALDDSNVIEKTLLSSDVTLQTLSCPSAGTTAVINTSQAQFNGLPAAVNGQTITLDKSSVTGDVEINKIINRWEVTTDLGGGPIVYELQSTEFEGVDLNCSGQFETTISCETLKPTPTAIVTSGTGALYRQSYSQSGWSDSESLVPNGETYTSWAQVSNNCQYQTTTTSTSESSGGGSSNEGGYDDDKDGDGNNDNNMGENADPGTTVSSGTTSGGGGGGGGCFIAGTMVKMADGTEKAIEQITLGDEVFMGGRVTATGAFLVTDIYDYMGVTVSGSHAVYEDGVWVRVRDAKQAKLLTDDIEVAVYVHVNEHHRIIINDIVFADYQEVGSDVSPHWKDIDDLHINIMNT